MLNTQTEFLRKIRAPAGMLETCLGFRVFSEYIVCFLKIHCLDLRDITYITLCGYIFVFSRFTFTALVSLLVQAQATILWGFVDALTKVMYTPRIMIGAIVENLIFEFKILKIELFI